METWEAPAYAVPRARFAVALPLQGEALLAFVILNALNVLDAVLTWYVLNRGLAVEGNPVIGVIGLPGKIALVAIAGWLVAQIRPRALLIPIVAVGLVALWTLGGGESRRRFSRSSHGTETTTTPRPKRPPLTLNDIIVILISHHLRRTQISIVSLGSRGISQMRILHLSDLHMSAKWAPDQEVVLNALVSDLRAQSQIEPIDLVVFGGDLAFGGQPSEFHLAESRLLDQILDVLSLSKTHLFLVPGNHDVDVGKIDPVVETGLSSRLIDHEALSEYWKDGFSKAHSSRLDTYTDFHQTYFGALAPNPLQPRGQARVLEIASQTVGIVGLDTSWRATGGAADADKGHLLVGESAVRAGIETVEGADLTVAVMHHPLDWLAKFDADIIRVLLEKHFDLVLMGHNHNADPHLVASTRGVCVYVQGGALYEGRGGHNTYSIINTEIDLVRVESRMLYEERQEFDVSSWLAQDGVAEFPLIRSDHTSEAIVISPSRAVDIAYSEIVGSFVQQARQTSVIADRVRDLDARSLDELLVSPVFLPLPHSQAMAATSESNEAVEEPDLVSHLVSGRSVLLVADRESGLTNSLWWLLEHVFTVDAKRVPVYVDRKKLESGKSFLKVLREALAVLGVATASDSLLPLVVAVDDIDSVPPRTVQRILKFIKENPESVFVLGCKEEGHAKVSEMIRDAELTIERAFLGPFGRRHLRRLLAKVATDVAPKVDIILDCLVTENLPRTPFVMAALVAVMSEGASGGETLSETALLERYTSLLLNRWGALEDPRVVLDYRDREHILGEFAAELRKRGASELTRVDAEGFLVDYFGRLGWQGSPGHVLDDLIERRVLMEQGEHVSFRHEALRQLFVGKRMNEDSEFSEAILANPLDEDSAIKHAAALKRNDIGLLTTIAEFGRSLVAGFKFPEESTLFAVSDPAPLPAGASGNEVNEVDYEPPSEEHKDDMWDAFEAGNHGESGEIRHLSDFGRLFFGTRLWSLVLRNSELVPQAPLKTDLLREVIQAWCSIAEATFEYEKARGPIRNLIEEIGSEVGGNQDLLDDEQRIEALIKQVITWHTASCLVSSLATNKLATPLATLLDDSALQADVGMAFFTTLLYCHIEGDDWPKRLRALFDEHGDHFVVRTMTRSLGLYQYHVSNLPKKQLRELESLLADVIMKERAPYPSAHQRTEAKNQLMRSIKQSRTRAQHKRTQLGPSEPFMTRDLTDSFDEEPTEE